MELRNITTFLRVAELQNFTHAAQELGYSQSAVTVQIRQLETELGVPLFERIGRSVSLTAPGQAFLQKAGEIIKAAERAKDAVRTAPEPEGTLRVGTMESLSASVVWRLITDFHRQFPQVNVVIRTSTADGLLEMMRRNDVDFIYFVPIDFPVFNVADCFVTIGTAVFAVGFIIDEARRIKSAKTHRTEE